MLAIIKQELVAIKEKYNDERKTQIVAHGVDNFSAEDLIPNEPTVVTITKDGYIKRLPPTTFKAQGRGGKGVIGLTTKEEDEVEHLFTTNTHNDILFFTNQGRVFQLKAYDIPQGSRTAKGQAIVNFLQLAPQEKVASVLPTDSVSKYKYLVMVTQHGFIKRVELEQFSNIRRSGLIAIKLKKDDNLQWVKPSIGNDDIVLISALGQAIRFKEKGVRAMGRGASGVRGMRLKGKDEVVGMAIVDPKLEKQLQLSIIMSLGFGKRTGLGQYKVQGRGGSGIKTAKITPKTGPIVAAYAIDTKEELEDLVIMSSHGQVIRLPFKSVPVLGRATQGVRLMRFKEASDKVASVTFV
jgi:DNA gyrase subunit A